MELIDIIHLVSLVVFATSIWASVEANRLEMHKYYQSWFCSWRWGGTFVACWFFSPIAIPLFLIKRSAIKSGKATLLDKYKEEKRKMDGETNSSNDASNDKSGAGWCGRIGSLCYIFAFVDFLTRTLDLYDITGVPYAPFIICLIGFIFHRFSINKK